MNEKVLFLENRINMLRGRDAIANANIIRKLERQLRKLREKN